MTSLCPDHNKRYNYYSSNSNSLKCNECKDKSKESDLIPINTIVEKKINEIEKMEQKLNYVKHNSFYRENFNMTEDELKQLFESVLCTKEILNQGQEEMTNFLKTCGIQLAKDVIAAKSFTSKEVVNRLSDDFMQIKQNLKDFLNIKGYGSFLNSLSNISLVTYSFEETMKYFKLMEAIFTKKEISSDSLGQYFMNLNSKVKPIIENAIKNIEISSFSENMNNGGNKFKKQGNPQRITKSEQEDIKDIEQKLSNHKKNHFHAWEKDESCAEFGNAPEINKKRKKPHKSSDNSDEEEIVHTKSSKEKGKVNEKKCRGRPKKVLSPEKVISIDEVNKKPPENKVSEKAEDKVNEGTANEKNSKDKEMQNEEKIELPGNEKEIYTSMKKKKLILFMRKNLEENKSKEPESKEEKDEEFEKLEKIEFNTSIPKSEAQRAQDQKLSESISKIINSSETGKKTKLYQLLKENLNVSELTFNIGKKLKKCPFILDVLKKISKIHKIIFEEIQFKDDDFEDLCVILQNIVVSSIKFEDCKIDSMKNSLTFFNKSKIQKLSFNSCKFKSDLTTMKSEVESLIKESKNIESLKMKTCKLSDELAEAFANGISENCTLKVLDFTGNNFTSEGLLRIFKSFEKNSSVEKIIMRCNKIDFEKVKDKLEVFVRNRVKELKLISD